MTDKAERALVYIAETIGMLGPKAPALPEYNNVLDVLTVTLYELDRVTAERDAARAAHAELIARLTRIANENEAMCRDHTSVGNDQDDAWVSAWGAAGKELREALGIESEASE